MNPADQSANIYSFASTGRRIELDLVDGVRTVGAHLRSGAQQLIDATARQACRQPLLVFGVATIVAAILTRSAWHPKAES